MSSRLEAFLVEGGATLIKPSGHNLISCCPFHADTKRSFSMSTETGQYICFAESCGMQGGLVSFLIKACSYPPKRAIELAEEYGVEARDGDVGEWLEIPDWKDRRKEGAVAEMNERSLAIYDFCPEYMLKRGFSRDTLRRWEIGWDFEALHVTIPVRDKQGRLVGISRRATKADAEFKYLHLGFAKSQYLYGQFFIPARPEGEVWVTEGQLDALAVHQLGIDYVVSSMGARVSTEQIRALSRYPKVVMAYDFDRDGRRAMRKIGDGLLERGKIPYLAKAYPKREHPEGEKWDPAELMRYGTEKEKKRFLSTFSRYDDVRLNSAWQ